MPHACLRTLSLLCKHISILPVPISHDALCLIFRHPHDPMTTTCLLAPVRLQSCLDSSTSINLRTVQFHVLVKCIHNLQHSLQLQVAFWKKQLHRSGAIQVDSCFSSKHRKKTKQQAGRPGWGRHSDWCRHQDSWHEVVSLLLDDAVSKNLWRMLSMAPKIQLVYGFVRSKRLQCRLVRVLQETCVLSGFSASCLAVCVE